MYICPCTFVDGKVYPDPNQECKNGHQSGDLIDQSQLLSEVKYLADKANGDTND